MLNKFKECFCFLIIFFTHHEVCGAALNEQYSKFVNEDVNSVDFTDPGICHFEPLNNSSPGTSVATIRKKPCTQKRIINEDDW